MGKLNDIYPGMGNPFKFSGNFENTTMHRQGKMDLDIKRGFHPF